MKILHHHPNVISMFLSPTMNDNVYHFVYSSSLVGFWTLSIFSLIYVGLSWSAGENFCNILFCKKKMRELVYATQCDGPQKQVNQINISNKKEGKKNT